MPARESLFCSGMRVILEIDLKDAGFDKQSFRVRITAHEVAVEFRGRLAVALAEDAAAEVAPGLRVEHPFLQEAAEGVRFQHFRPFVGVVARLPPTGPGLPERRPYPLRFPPERQPDVPQKSLPVREGAWGEPPADPLRRGGACCRVLQS